MHVQVYRHRGRLVVDLNDLIAGMRWLADTSEGTVAEAHRFTASVLEQIGVSATR